MLALRSYSESGNREVECGPSSAAIIQSGEDVFWMGYESFMPYGTKDIDHTTKRAAIFKAEAKKIGVKVKDIYWTMGDHDGLLILEAPDDETAAAAIMHLGAMGNVHTSTCRAFTAAEMDNIVSKVHGG